MIEIGFCVLQDRDFDTVSTTPYNLQRSGVTAFTVVSPLINCDPDEGYTVGVDWYVPYPDGSFTSGGLYTIQSWEGC